LWREAGGDRIASRGTAFREFSGGWRGLPHRLGRPSVPAPFFRERACTQTFLALGAAVCALPHARHRSDSVDGTRREKSSNGPVARDWPSGAGRAHFAALPPFGEPVLQLRADGPARERLGRSIRKLCPFRAPALGPCFGE